MLLSSRPAESVHNPTGDENTVHVERLAPGFSSIFLGSMVGGLDSRDHLRLCHWCLCGQQQYHGYLVNTDFGVVGSFCKKLDYPIAPMVLALVLGDMAESKLRQSLIMSQESPLILVTRPRSPVLVVLALGLFASPVIPALLHRWHQGLSGNWRLTRG